jgi:Tol biopolymer transport system component
MIGTGELKNLSNSPDQTELFGMWWPGRPDSVILGSRPITREPSPSTGHLTIVSVETGEYKVLDEENISNGYPAPSPNGQRIAYDRGGTPWIYDLVSGPELFDLDTYNFYVAVGSQQITLASPSWSPNGTRLAWVMGGGLAQDASYRIGIAIFDLEAKTAVLLHPYIPIGRGGWPPAPVWSPDGQWLAFTTSSQEETNGLWVARSDGFDETVLGKGANPIWSPDSSQLAFDRFEDQHSVWIARVGERKPEKVYLPPDSSIKAWYTVD